MEQSPYHEFVRKWLWLTLLAAAVAAVGAWVGTAFTPRTYASVTTLMVGRPLSNGAIINSGITTSESLAKIYAQMATRQPVLAGVVKTLRLDTDWKVLRKMVKANPIPGASLIEIRVIDTDPERAQILATEIGNQLILQSPTPTDRQKLDNKGFVDAQVSSLRQNITRTEAELKELDGKLGIETSARAIADLQGLRSAKESQIETWRTQFANLSMTVEGSTVNSLSVIELAAPGEPVGPNVLANVLLAAALGMGLAIGAVLALEYLDDTVKTNVDVERKLGLVELATVLHVQGVVDRKGGLVTLLQPRSSAAEAYRVLRTNLQFSLLDVPDPILVVTSANPAEGKSTTAANLAVVLAQGGRKVIVVDTDLRRPSLHRIFDVPNSVGMTTLFLEEQVPIESAMRHIPTVSGLDILTSGPLPPNPSEVLDSGRMTRLMQELRERYDIIVMDSPPLLAVVDAAILAKRADGTVLVCDSGTTRTDSARRAVDLLRKVGVTPIGAVVNNLVPRRVGYYGDYRYAGDYGAYHSTPEDGAGGDGGPPASGSSRAPQPLSSDGALGQLGLLGKLRRTVTGWLG